MHRTSLLKNGASQFALKREAVDMKASQRLWVLLPSAGLRTLLGITQLSAEVENLYRLKTASPRQAETAPLPLHVAASADLREPESLSGALEGEPASSIEIGAADTVYPEKDGINGTRAARD